MPNETGLTRNHVSPVWSNLLLKAGLSPISLYTWVLNERTGEYILRCYPLDDYGLMRNADANVGLITPLQYFPAWTIGELMHILPPYQYDSFINESGYQVFRCRYEEKEYKNLRFADLLAQLAYEQLCANPTLAEDMNMLLAKF